MKRQSNHADKAAKRLGVAASLMLFVGMAFAEVPLALPRLDLTNVRDREAAAVLLRNASAAGLSRQGDSLDLPSGLTSQDLLSLEVKRVEETLKSLGYLDAMAPVAADGRIVPMPGRKYRIGSVVVDGLAEVAADDRLVLYLNAQLRRQTGADVRSESLTKLEGDVVRLLKDFGYAKAQVVGEFLTRDLVAGLVDVDLSIAPGRVYRFGPAQFVGLRHADPASLVQYLTFREGDLFSQQALDDLRDRLDALGRFYRITVRPGEPVDGKGQLPIVIDLGERNLPPDALPKWQAGEMLLLIVAFCLLLTYEIFVAAGASGAGRRGLGRLAVAATLAASVVLALHFRDIISLSGVPV